MICPVGKSKINYFSNRISKQEKFFSAEDLAAITINSFVTRSPVKRNLALDRSFTKKNLQRSFRVVDVFVVAVVVIVNVIIVVSVNLVVVNIAVSM